MVRKGVIWIAWTEFNNGLACWCSTFVTRTIPGYKAAVASLERATASRVLAPDGAVVIMPGFDIGNLFKGATPGTGLTTVSVSPAPQANNTINPVSQAPTVGKSAVTGLPTNKVSTPKVATSPPPCQLSFPHRAPNHELLQAKGEYSSLFSILIHSVSMFLAMILTYPSRKFRVLPTCLYPGMAANLDSLAPIRSKHRKHLRSATPLPMRRSSSALYNSLFHVQISDCTIVVPLCAVSGPNGEERTARICSC